MKKKKHTHAHAQLLTIIKYRTHNLPRQQLGFHMADAVFSTHSPRVFPLKTQRRESSLEALKPPIGYYTTPGIAAQIQRNLELSRRNLTRKTGAYQAHVQPGYLVFIFRLCQKGFRQIPSARRTISRRCHHYQQQPITSARIKIIKKPSASCTATKSLAPFTPTQSLASSMATTSLRLPPPVPSAPFMYL